MQLDTLNNGHTRVAFLMSMGVGSNKTINNDDDTFTHECFAYQSETLFFILLLLLLCERLCAWPAKVHLHLKGPRQCTGLLKGAPVDVFALVSKAYSTELKSSLVSFLVRKALPIHLKMV